MFKRKNIKEIRLFLIVIFTLCVFLGLILINRNVFHIVDIETKKEMETGTQIHVEVYNNMTSEVKTVLIITNPVGIDEITIGSNKLNGKGKTSVGIDFSRVMYDSVYVSVKDMNSSVVTETVDISQDDVDSKIGIIDNSPTDDIYKNISLTFNNQLSDVGVKKYYKIGVNNTWQEYTTGNLEFNAYYTNLHKYQNQDNTITIFGKIEDSTGNVVLNSKKCLLDSSAVAMEIIPNTPVTASNVSTFPGLVIRNECQEPIKGIIVQFTSSIVAGDKIELTASGTFVPQNGTSYVYVNTEGKTLEEIQAYLRANLKITTYNAVQVKFSIGTMIYTSVLPYCADTSHYYEYVAAPGITWANAKNAAANRTYLGVNGYLATITSTAENSFMQSLVSGQGWLGGTCDYNYIFDSSGKQIYISLSQSIGNWHWATGPEAGQKFYSTSQGPLIYSNWASGEPNNYGSEYCLHTYVNGTWNDYNNGNGAISGYIVEYGGVNDANLYEDEIVCTTTITLGT